MRANRYAHLLESNHEIACFYVMCSVCKGSVLADCDGQQSADSVEKVGLGFHDRKVRV